MAQKKRTAATTNTHPASGNGPGGAPSHSAARQRTHTPGATESEPRKNPQQAAAALSSADEPPPPGLDEARIPTFFVSAPQEERARVADEIRAYAPVLSGNGSFVFRGHFPGLDPAIQREAFDTLVEEVVPLLRT